MALQNKTIGMQTAWLLQSQSISLEVNINKEEVLTLNGPAGSVVPMQQIGNQKVRLRLEEEPTVPGNYDLVDKKEQLVQQLSLNVPRTESDITQRSNYLNRKILIRLKIQTNRNQSLESLCIFGTLIFGFRNLNSKIPTITQHIAYATINPTSNAVCT
jgi:hypothetical protein